MTQVENGSTPKLATHHEMPWLKSYEKYGIEYEIDLPPEGQILLDVFDNIFQKHGDNTAFVCMDAKITFRELEIYTRQFASYLQGLGLKKGDKVAVMLPNILQYPICMIGILRAGLILVNVNPLYTSHELAHQLADSEAKVLVTVENFAHTYQKIGKDLVEKVVIATMGDLLGTVRGYAVNNALRHIQKVIPEWDIPNHVMFLSALNAVPADKYVRPTDITPQDIAVLQYTGGTTGVSKGAMLTHYNLCANMLQAMSSIKYSFPEENQYGQYQVIALPLYHIYAFTVCGLLGMSVGFAGLLIPNPRDLDGFVKEYDKYKPALFPSVNTLFNGLLHHEGFRQLDHSNLRSCSGGGMATMEMVSEGWFKLTNTRILEGYGLSETSPVAIKNPHNVDRFTDSIGIPAPMTDVKIVNDDDQEVAIGERGEIAIKGPQVMLGYWKRPDETAKVMTADGYFKTGDIGIMDENGFIKLVDRKKDMILVSGFNVYPMEVEEILSKHPKILECGVIAVPDEYSGEVPKAFIVKKDPSLTEDEVFAYAKELLTGYKRPKFVEFIAELPKSNVGKILRRELRELQNKANA